MLSVSFSMPMRRSSSAPMNVEATQLRARKTPEMNQP